MTKALTPEQRAELFQLYFDGGVNAVEHLSERYGMSLEYIGKLARRNGYVRNEMVYWKPEEVILARRLLDEGAPESAFKAQLNRTRQACFNKVTRTDRGSIIVPAVTIPPEVLEDRVRRLTAPRSITALLMGDPCPGKSALDRRGAQA